MGMDGFRSPQRSGFGDGPGGGGAVVFTDLTDTPNTYAGAALLSVRVNAGATGLEFVAAPGAQTAPVYDAVGFNVANKDTVISRVGPGELQIGSAAGLADGALTVDTLNATNLSVPTSDFDLVRFDLANLDAGLSRVSAGVLGVGNGTLGDVSGSVHAASHVVYSSGAVRGFVGTNGGVSTQVIANSSGSYDWGSPTWAGDNATDTSLQRIVAGEVGLGSGTAGGNTDGVLNVSGVVGKTSIKAGQGTTSLASIAIGGDSGDGFSGIPNTVYHLADSGVRATLTATDFMLAANVTLNLTESAAPGAAPTGEVALYSKADGLVYSVDSAGAEAGPFGKAPVATVFGRTGDVVAVLGDYLASEVENDSGVAGATVADALDNVVAGAVSFPLLGPDGTLAAATYSFANFPNTGMNTDVGGAVILNSSGVEIAKLSNGGVDISRNLIARAGITLQNTALADVGQIIFGGAEPQIDNGTVSPEGVIEAPQGSLQLVRSDAVSSLWVKQTGIGNTGWVDALGGGGGSMELIGTAHSAVDGTLTVTVPAGTLTKNGDQLHIEGIGLATSTGTGTLAFGGTEIVNTTNVIVANSRFGVVATVIYTGASSQYTIAETSNMDDALETSSRGARRTTTLPKNWAAPIDVVLSWAVPSSQKAEWLRVWKCAE